MQTLVAAGRSLSTDLNRQGRVSNHEHVDNRNRTAPADAELLGALASYRTWFSGPEPRVCEQTFRRNLAAH